MGPLQQAADAGSVHAMTNLGDVYLEGLGVEKNRDTAKTFYMAGASVGNVIARRRLFEEFGIVYNLNREQTVESVAALPKPKNVAVQPVTQSPIPMVTQMP